MEAIREYDKEVLRSAAIQELRKLGFKNILILEKTRQKGYEDKKHVVKNKLFKVELNSLPRRVISSKSGVTIEVPSFVADACEFIEENITNEGLFRKAGSNARQKEIKVALEDGEGLRKDYNVIDVANTLKLFFRELQEPLIPYSYHVAFSRCLKMKDKVTECLLLCCLLLPVLPLSTLIYFTQFLRKVADYSDKNKMDITNLSIIMTPTLMPVEGRVTENISVKGFQLSNHVKVIELLIRNSHTLGEFPEDLLKRLPSFVDTSKVIFHTTRMDLPDGVKKKKRSESMTRVLSGFRRMVRKSPTPNTGSSNSTELSDRSFSFQKTGKRENAVESSASSAISKLHDVMMTVTRRSSLTKSAHYSLPPNIESPYLACGHYSPKVCFHSNASPNVCGGRSCVHGAPGKTDKVLCKTIGKKDQMKTTRSDIQHFTSSDLKKCESYDNVSKANAFEPKMNTTPEVTINNWQPASKFQNDPRLSDQPVTGRESVTKLRAQNAGKVLASVKLFERIGRIRSKKVLNWSGTSSTNLNQNFSVSYKNTNGNTVINEKKSNSLTSLATGSPATLVISHKNITKPSRSPSEFSSPMVRQEDLRHHGRPSGHGKSHRRKHQSFSPFRHKRNLFDQSPELSKENLIHPLERLTENVVSEYNDFKEVQNSPLSSVFTNIHLSPFQDSNIILSKRESPTYNSPIVSISPGGTIKYSKMKNSKIHKTLCVVGSSLDKQPNLSLTSCHKSLWRISTFRKKAGKTSPM